MNLSNVPSKDPSAALALAQTLIEGVATPYFFEALAAGVRRLVDCDAITIIQHRPADEPRIVYHDFEGRAVEALQRYVHETHRYDPFVVALDFRRPVAVYRMRDLPRARLGANAQLVLTDDEEIGYHTVDWPARYEEVGLVLTSDRTAALQIALYRRLGEPADGRTFSDGDLGSLAACSGLLGSAARRQTAWEARELEGEPASLLTPREREVVEMVLRGHRSNTIARRLGISLLTVKSHRKSAYRKLGVETLAGLFALFDTATPASLETE